MISQDGQLACPCGQCGCGVTDEPHGQETGPSYLAGEDQQ
jgi:hypothetical protein